MSVVSVLLLRKRIITKKLQQCGAVSEATATSLEEAGVPNPKAFLKVNEKLVKDKVLIKTKDNKYYLAK